MLFARSWIVFIFLTGGCATSSFRQIEQSTSHLAPQTFIQGVPLIEQKDNFCGPAALAMVLQWSGDAANMEDLAKQVYTPNLQGTLQNDMLSAARRHGRLSLVLNRPQDVFEEVAQGHPVIVLQNLGLSWYTRWHYAVVVGYDLQKSEVYLNSGENKQTTLSLDTFANTWARSQNWALLVLPTHKLPVSQRELDITAAAVALEETAGPQKAEPVYREILKKWPKSIGARFGLSNTLYAEKNKTAAAQELRQIVKDYPKMAPAWHNLSLILKELKKNKEAQAAALKAQETATAQEREKYREQFLTH
jgi:tetratricopeptide (TPR) repeat protein